MTDFEPANLPLSETEKPREIRPVKISVNRSASGTSPDIEHRTETVNILLEAYHTFQVITHRNANTTIAETEIKDADNKPSLKTTRLINEAKALKALNMAMHSLSSKGDLPLFDLNRLKQEVTETRELVGPDSALTLTQEVVIDDSKDLDFMISAIRISDHDLKNKITSINAHADLAQRRVRSGQELAGIKEDLDSIRDVSKSLEQELIKDLELILHPLKKEKIEGDDIRRLLSSEVGAIYHKGGRIFGDINLPDNYKSLPITWNPIWFASLAENIATNTVKAYEVRSNKQEYRENEEKSLTVNFEVDREKGHLRIIFEDRGPGFPETEDNNIPRDGFQPEKSDWQGVASGTGIGMHTHQQMLREHFGGDIKVENVKTDDPYGREQEVVIGARIIVSVPLA